MGVSAEDHWQALATLHRYCWAIDHHDESALREVFSEESVLAIRPPLGGAAESSVSGRDAVVRTLVSFFARRSWARHWVSNELVEAGADGSLKISCYFRFVLAEAAGAVEGLGDYVADLVPRGDEFAISRLEVSILEQAVRPVR
jgi:hypothetical protein